MLLHNIAKLVQTEVGKNHIGWNSGDHVVLHFIGKHTLYKEGASGNGVCRYVNRCYVQGDLGIRYEREKICMVTVAAFTVSSFTRFTTTLEQAVPKSLVFVIYPVVKAKTIILSNTEYWKIPVGMLLYYESTE